MLFLAVAFLFIIVLNFYKSYKAQSMVWKSSRCYNDTSGNQRGRVYTINARTNGRPAFDMEYDFQNKTTKLTCACAPGNVNNTFGNIPYYNIRAPSDSRIEYKSLACGCESPISVSNVKTSNDMTYTGNTTVRLFMQDPAANKSAMDAFVLTTEDA